MKTIVKVNTNAKKVCEENLICEEERKMVRKT